MKLRAAGILFPVFEIKNIGNLCSWKQCELWSFYTCVKMHITFYIAYMYAFYLHDSRHVLQTTFVETVCHKQGI